jgi:hypothetical protein
MTTRKKGFLGTYVLATGLVTASLAACGGGGEDGSNSGGTGTSYAFVPPVVGSSRVYDETIVDNSNNTIEGISYMKTVQSVQTDGTIIEQQQEVSGPGGTVNGTNYSITTETQTYNNIGRETAYTYTESSGSPGACTYSPRAGGPVPPLQVGQTWQLDYTETCNNNAPIAYVQNGSVVDVESVTVPGGTFTALKLQSTIVWTDANGTTHTETSTDWIDTATFHSVKESDTLVDSGTLPTTGYAVSRSIELSSTS